MQKRAGKKSGGRRAGAGGGGRADGGEPRCGARAEVRTAEQFDAISSPIRDQVLQVIYIQAPARAGAEPRGVSVREIAHQLGRKPASLYRHIEELVRVGLVREVGTGASGGRDATLYAGLGEVVRLVPPDREGADLDAICRYTTRMAAHAGQETAAATRERRPDRHVDVATLSMFGWLDAAQRLEVQELIIRMARVYARAHRRPGTRLIASTMLIRPVRLPDGSTLEEAEDRGARAKKTGASGDAPVAKKRVARTKKK